MKTIFKTLFPKQLWDRMRNWQRGNLHSERLQQNFAYDKERYEISASSKRDFARPQHHLAYLIMLYHSLEKGMSMPDPRPGYGRAKADELLKEVVICLELGVRDSHVNSALSVLTTYVEFNKTLGVVFSKIEDDIHQIREMYRVELTEVPIRDTGGGRRLVNQTPVNDQVAKEFEAFVYSRHSIRDFTDRPIAVDSIALAVHIAQKSPSVCNRQSARVHVFENNDLGSKILKLQNGNTGFGHTANKIFIITSDLSAFLSIGERNQSWIDGGLFAMTFIFALHSQGIGTCCLNWSKEFEDDKSLRKLADIPEEENIIMLIAAGYPPESAFVPWSHRRPVNDVISFH